MGLTHSFHNLQGKFRFASYDGVEMKGKGVSASAIAEARINNDPYSIETNRPGKGRFEIITKPGSSQFHGILNFTFRD